MFSKMYMKIGLALLLILGVVLAACAAPSPAPPVTPPPATKPAPTPTPLDSIIEGAKREGSVSVLLGTEYTDETIKKLEKEIQQKFDVKLDIKNTQTVAVYAQEMAKAIMEHKAGAPPSYDLMNTTTNNMLAGVDAGIFEKVDWKPILIEGTNPDVIVQAGIPTVITISVLMGMMYNPQKVTADEIPKTLSGWGDPKWKGKVACFNYPAAWAKWAWVLGKEKTLADMRALMQNGAIPGRHSEVLNRYLIGEVVVAFTQTTYKNEAVKKGMPAAWKNPGFLDIQQNCFTVRTGAKSPNAAKLIASYLVSQEGAKFTFNEIRAENNFYPSEMYDIVQKGKKEGMKISDGAEPDWIAYTGSKEYQDLVKEIQIIISGK